MSGDAAMPMGRPKADLVLEPAERAQLQSMVRSRSIPAALQARAQIVLASAGGEPNSSIAARLGFTNATFVPTYSSWLNLAEHFFALITTRAIRRGSFRSVRELVQHIDHLVNHHNTNCKPFIWTATADSILAKLQRLCVRISGTGH